MTTMVGHLSNEELEARYEAAANPFARAIFMRCGCCLADMRLKRSREILSISPRWVRALLKRYNEGGAEALGDQRIHNATKPTILRTRRWRPSRRGSRRRRTMAGFGRGPRLRAGLRSSTGCDPCTTSAGGMP